MSKVFNEFGGYSSPEMTADQLDKHYELVEASRAREAVQRHWNEFRYSQTSSPDGFTYLENAEASERLGRTRGIAQMTAFRTHLAFVRLTS